MIHPYWTDAELARLKQLRVRLSKAVPHSRKAIATGQLIGRVYWQAHIRNNPPNPAIDRAMKTLSQSQGSKQLGIQ